MSTLFTILATKTEVKKGTLLLVPVTLGSEYPEESIPVFVLEEIKNLRHFIVEDLRSARRFLRRVDTKFPIDDTEFLVIDKHSSLKEGSIFLNAAANGMDTGLMSEAGLPGVADPGSFIIAEAHRQGIRVKPLPGPSSIILALISSGMNGQSFAFRGYLPVKQPERITAIKELESRAAGGESQIFMETPYRNMKLLNDIFAVCHPDTRLCVAAAITLKNEFIKTLTVREWRLVPPKIDKTPAIFVLAK
jgi:16S rRNA (cytidine1402-2'-O)-methyltransferase